MALSRDEKFWQRAAIALTLLALIAATWAGVIFKERMDLESHTAAVISGKELVLSSESKDELRTLMKEEPLIIGISAVSISLTSNIRHITFFETAHPEFKIAFDEYIAVRKKEPPVFNENPNQNSRITSILNGNFECRMTKDTVIGSQFDEAARYAPIVCSAAVPPGFHESRDFVGFVNFFIRVDKLTDSDKGRLAAKAVAISANIYNRDLSDHK